MVNILSIGGSDPSGAAGVQRDARVVSSLGFHPLSVVTAVTAQNTSRFLGTVPVDADMISLQLEAVVSDFEVHGIKIGMVWDSAAIRHIAEKIRGMDAPVVLDPVVRSTTGGLLLEESAREDLAGVLMPLAGVATPNRYEAEHLAGIDVVDVASAREAAHAISRMGPPSVVVTGVADAGEEVVDVVYSGGTFHQVRGARLAAENRGGGCTYSVGLACFLASGHALPDAARLAHDLAYRSIRDSTAAGRGIRVAADPGGDGATLGVSIEEFIAIPGISALIPQCQTNFVYAPSDSVSPGEVLGIEGRIVRTGGSVVRAGRILPGGSKHVAAAVCAIRARFPHLRSAANIRYSPDILSGMVREGFAVAFYDRGAEPSQVKESGSSVAWGVGEAAALSETPPDAVCHRGDFGKEPMIIVFGETPSGVVSKLHRLVLSLK